MDLHTLKKEISDKLHSHSKSTSLYRTAYNEFHKTVPSYTNSDNNFSLSRSQFASVIQNLNIKTDDSTIDQLYRTIDPTNNNISYDEIVTRLVN